MGLLSRRKDESGPDPYLTMLTVAQADRLRALARSTLADHGLETAVHPDHLVDADGREFGLWNLAASVAGDKERRWPGLVAQHLSRLLAAMDGPDALATMSAEQVEAAVFARLYDEGGLPDPSRYAYADEVAPGVRVLLAVDLPDTVALLADEEVARFGGADALLAAGLRNLDRLEPDHDSLRGPDGASFEVVTGDDVFTASLALRLPDVVRRATGETDLSDGVLLCVPFRHQLAFSVVRDASAVPTLAAMVQLALDGHAEGAGPVSPWLYWWHAGSWSQVSRWDEDRGEVVVELPQGLQEVLERVVP